MSEDQEMKVEEAAETAPKAVSKSEQRRHAIQGAQPTARRRDAPDPNKLDKFGFRTGSLKSRAAHMYASKHGATLADVKGALHSTQFNVITELEGKGFVVERTPVSGDKDRKATRYHVLAK